MKTDPNQESRYLQAVNEAMFPINELSDAAFSVLEEAIQNNELGQHMTKGEIDGLAEALLDCAISGKEGPDED